MSGRQKTDLKREQILAAAASEFGAREFDQVLMDDVAARAGVGKGTLYRYFPAKGELFVATVLSGFDEFHLDSLRVLEEAAPLEQVLRELALHMLRFLWNRGEFLELLLRYEHRLPRADAEAWRQRRAQLIDALGERLAREVRRGVLRPLNPGRVAAMFVGMIRSVVMYRKPDPEEKVEDVAGEIVDLLWKGIVRSPSRASAPRRPLRAVRGGRS